MIPSTQPVKLHPEVVFTKIGDNEGVLLHLGTKMYYSLNETGVCIWELLGSGLAPFEISEQLQEKFPISSEKAAHSVTAFVSDLAREDLIED